MKTLFMNIALLLSVTAQAQTRDSIDVCQFVVVYDHLIHAFTFAGLLNRQAPITYPEGSNRQGLTLGKFISHRNKVLCNKRYAQNPRYYLPEGALDAAIEMWPGGPEPAPEDKMTVLATDMVVPKTAHVYQPLELE
ncbi:MAG: hypothetical protein IJV33_06550 [Bacteroidaceae bacterium]|nr:hypothetical protein [Bacteroidaceae bacterium]